MPLPANLIDAVENRQAVLFAGAGISIKALGFAGRYIKEQVGEQIQRDYHSYDYDSRSFETACDEYAVLNDRTSLVNLLAGLIPQNAQPQTSHETAVRLFRFIVTTNWDLLFEEAYKKAGQGYQVLSSDADAPNFNYDQHNLLKIHGSADKPLSLIATTDDYESYFDTHAMIEDKVGELVSNNTVIFVGYGFGDEHVRHLLARIRRKRGPWARKAYAVGYYDDVRTKVLDRRNIEVLDMDADDFFDELGKQLP
ncbi:MAG: SIR2 family protein [Pseudomonadota bacterium]